MMIAESYDVQRHNMVEGQLRPNKVNQRAVLARFASVPRESFVAEPATAYLDQPAALASGRESFSPMVCARLVQALGVTEQDNVLVAACGMGYAAAILAPMCQSVVGVEDDAALAKQAESNCTVQGLQNVKIEIDSPAQGYAAGAPYQAILVEAPFAELAPEWREQLAEGGRLAGVRIGSDGIPEAVVYTRHGKSLVAEVLFETKGKVHPAFAVSEKFVF